MLVVASLVASGAGVSDRVPGQIERELHAALSRSTGTMLATLVKFPYRWAWGQKPGWDRGTPPRVFDRDRKGERCRVLARGRLNSCLLEFVDGYRVVTSRNGLRRA